MKKIKSPKRIKRDKDLEKLRFLFLGNQKNGALAHNELFRLAYASIFNQTALIDDDQIRLIPDQEKKTDQKRLNRKYIYDLFNDLTKRFPVDSTGKYSDKIYKVKSKSWKVGNEKNIISKFLTNDPIYLGHRLRKGLSIASVVKNFDANKDLILPTSDNRSRWNDGRPPIGVDLVARWRSGALAPIKRYRPLLVLIIYNWYMNTLYKKAKGLPNDEDYQLANQVIHLATILDHKTDLDDLDPLNLFSIMLCSLMNFYWLHELQRAFDYGLSDKECFNYLKFIYDDFSNDYSDSQIRKTIKMLRVVLPKFGKQSPSRIHSFVNKDVPRAIFSRIDVPIDPITQNETGAGQLYFDEVTRVQAEDWLQENIPMVHKQIISLKKDIQQIKSMQKDFQYIGGK